MNKKFDCVEMKNEIQRKRQAEYTGLSLEERKALMDKRIKSDPILGPVYMKLLRTNGDSRLMVAEESPAYGVNNKK